MALPKTTPTSLELKATIAPYQHELNNDGKGCLKDCPAALPIILSTASTHCSSSEEATWNARLMSAVCPRRNSGTNISRPFSVSDTVLTRQFGAALYSVVGGLSILLGYRAKIGAWLIAVFLISVTPRYNFWAVHDPMMAQIQVMFMKNGSVLGGALLISQFDAGPLSLDARARFQPSTTDDDIRVIFSRILNRKIMRFPSC